VPPEISKRHGRLIRTGLSALVAYLVREAARTTAANAIGVEAVIPGPDEKGAVAVHIDTI
jgi:hypothetical protein